MGDDAEWHRLDETFVENDLHGPADGPSWLIEPGSRPVVFTAVHGVVHYRPGVGLKSAEARTGGLARVLAVSLGTTAAVVLRAGGDPDANFDPQHPLKRALLRRGLVRPGVAVLDLHGMTNDHPADVAIGWGPDARLGGPLAALAVAAFEEHGFCVDPDGALSGLYGAGAGTVTTFSQQHGAPAIQIEIARRNRTFLSGEDRRDRLLRSFRHLVGQLDGGAPVRSDAENGCD